LAELLSLRGSWVQIPPPAPISNPRIEDFALIQIDKCISETRKSSIWDIINLDDRLLPLIGIKCSLGVSRFLSAKEVIRYGKED